jgi:SP family galactose:H+ symporter-like MFS transporter
LNNRIIYFTCIFGALGGLLFGLEQGFISNSLKTISNYYQLTLSQSQHYSAMLAWGAICGTLFSCISVRFFGRKKILVLAGSIFVLMSLVSAFLPKFDIFSYCRFGLGFAVGICSFNVPVYLAEIAPTSIRGAMISLFQTMITAGMFIISVLNITVVNFLGPFSISIRVMFYFIVLFAMIMLVGALFLPESPRWLISKGKEADALAILYKIRNNKSELSKEVMEIKKTVNDSSEFFDSSKIKKFSKILLVGIFLQLFQQLVGINMMVYYSPVIFEYANITGIVSLLIVPFFLMICTFPAIIWIEKFGRKRLLHIGSIVMMLSMVFSGIAFLFIDMYSCKLLLLLSCITYICGFSFSWGPVVWVLCSEIFPIRYREIGVTMTTMTNWLFAGVVMSYSLSVMNTYGNSTIFFVFAIFCLFSIFFSKFFVPETNKISLENIEKNL